MAAKKSEVAGSAPKAEDAKFVIFLNDSGRGVLVTVEKGEELLKSAKHKAWLERVDCKSRVVKPGDDGFEKLEYAATGKNYDTKTGTFVKDE